MSEKVDTGENLGSSRCPTFLEVDVDDFGTLFQRWKFTDLPRVGDMVYVDTGTRWIFEPLKVLGREFNNSEGIVLIRMESIEFSVKDGEVDGKDASDVTYDAMLQSGLWHEHWRECP